MGKMTQQLFDLNYSAKKPVFDDESLFTPFVEKVNKQIIDRKKETSF